MADLMKPDLCVIGAGALGIELALRARQRGLAVVLVATREADAVDPTGGSLQRAALLASAGRAHAIRTAALVGLDNAAPKPNFRAISEHAAALAESIAPLSADERLAAQGITLLQGEARFIDRNTLRCGEVTVRARQFALATGSAPRIPELPGLDAIPFFTPDTIGDNLRKLTHLVVIGGGPEALELAQAYCRLGSQVTLVPQGGLLPGFEPELVAILLRSLRAEGLVIRDDAEVTAIVPRSQGTGITLRVAEGEDSLDVSHVLLAMARIPLLDDALLATLALRRDRLRPDHLLVGPNGQTSNGRVTALGGAAGEFRAHVALRQADLLIDRLLGRGNGRLEQHQVPSHVATQPALAQVGQGDAGTKARTGLMVLRANLAENQAARAFGMAEGTVRLVVDRKGHVVGASAVGEGAGELVALIALGMARGVPLAELARLALPQPSLAAALLDIARQHVDRQPQGSWSARLASRLIRPH
jgi:pyruvate/2-oxoglutarate dehydrogenase complex dihydrolipoamide dehydrogenase (E3) component